MFLDLYSQGMLRFYNRSSVRITGKTISNEGVGIFELKQGKVIKSQVQTDRLGFLQEMKRCRWI